MKRLVVYISPEKGRIAVQMTIKFAGTVLDLFIPWILSYIIDSVVPNKDKTGIYLWGLVMFLCALFALIANIVGNRMAARISGDITARIRHDLFEKTMKLSCRETDRLTEPSLISRLTSDTYFFYQMLMRMQRMGVRAPILLVGGCAVTLVLQPIMALVLIAMLPILGVAVYRISKKGVPLYTKIQKIADGMVRRVREYMSGIRVILALSRKDYERKRFERVNKKGAAAEQKAGYVMSLTNPVMNFLLNFGMALVIVVGAYLVNGGLTQPGKIIAFMTYFTIILNAMLGITKIFVVFSKGTASAARIAEVLDAPDELAPLTEEDAAESEAHIEFRNISFSYTGGKDDLHDLSFTLKRGETLGIIGATGSGKSTLLMLLLRFYDPDSGEILIDGQNIKGILHEELYAKYGTVFQNDILFSTTIGDNIAFGRDVPEEELVSAAKTARADFIYTKENAFDYPLDIRGGNLSGGQKQRLLIARSLAKKPEILLLDDVSSALDYRTDAKLRKALSADFAGTTKIIVSQRISSVMNADQILVLDKGAVLGEGVHKELMESCTEYRDIYTIQMGGAAR